MIMKFNKGSSRTKHNVPVAVGNPMHDHMMDLSQLFMGPKFAQGANSRLYHGTYNDQPVAVKVIQVLEFDDEKHEQLADSMEKLFNQEVTILSRLEHPNVIKLIASYKQASVHCIVTEYLSQGSLRTHLNKLKHDKTCLPLPKLVTIALEIARGMEYVHSKGVIHRDLKPENVLIDDGFHMKIADFGVSCKEGSCPVSDQQGTCRWMAPEMIRGKSYSRKVDVYSFGLMLSEMVSGSLPYEDMTPVQAAYAVANKNLRPVLPKEYPLLVRDLIERCWSSKPKKRPEFWQIVKVLEQFGTSLACDGTLKQVQWPRSVCQDHKKGFLHWILHHGSAVHVIS